MAEYKLTYHKFPRFSAKEEHEQFESLIHPAESKDDEKQTPDRDMITLGNFDRLTIEQEHSFTRARDFSLFSRGWNGDRLSLLLYDLGEKDALKDLRLRYDKQSKLCYFEGETARFVVMTFFNLSDRLIPVSFKATEELHGFLLTKIAGIPKPSGVRCALMGCFGMADYCLVTLTDDYDEALKLAERLKAVQVKNGGKDIFLFSEFYTCVSLNRGHTTLEGLHHPAVLYVATKGVLSAKAFQSAMLKAINDTELGERLAESELQYVFGEYDLALRAEAQYLIPLVEKGNPFHFSSKFYQDTVLRTQIQLLTEPTEKGMSETWELPEGFYFLGEGELVCSFKEIRNLIEGDYGLRKQLKAAFPPTSCFVDDFDALYHDFRNYLFSTAKLQRRLDCAYRFKTVLLLIREATEKIQGRKGTEGYFLIDTKATMEEIRSLMEIMKIQLQQERMITMLELDSPLCQSNFNGHQDMILHSYNNYLKELFYLLYRREHQPKLVPLVTSSTVFQIFSTQYSETVEGESVSLLRYELPTAVMTDLPFGLANILHETFHYVPPRYREDRNIYVGCIFLCELTLHYYCGAMAELMMEGEQGIDTSSEEIALWETFYWECIRSGSLGKFMADILRELASRYENWFAIRNPNHYFAEFCDLLTDKLLWPDDTGDCYGNLFSRCLAIAGELFDSVITEKEYTMAPEERSYYFREPGCSAAVTQRFSESLKENGNFFAENLIQRFRENLLDPYREVKADIGMLTVTGMSLTDYLLMYTEDVLLVRGKTSPHPEQEYLRLLMVTVFFTQGEEPRKAATVKLSEIEEEYIRRYIARFLTKAAHEWTREEGIKKAEKHYAQCRKKAIKFFEYFQSALKTAEDRLSPYTRLSERILELMVPQSITDQEDSGGKSLIDLTKQYFAVLREAEIRCGNTLSEEMSREPSEAGKTEILTAVEAFQRAELQESLQLIHKLQKTCLLSKIETPKQEEP